MLAFRRIGSGLTLAVAAPFRSARLQQLSAHALWLSVACALPLAVDRLGIAPHLNRVLGADVFAAFLWCQGMFLITGSFVANGAAVVMFRRFVNEDPQRAPRMLRSALLLTAAGNLLIIPLAVLLAASIAPPGVLAQAWPLFTCLSVLTAIRALDHLLVSMLRIRQSYVTFLGLRLLETSLLVGGLCTLSFSSLWQVGGLYLASAGTAFLVNVAIHWNLLSGGGWFDRNYFWLLVSGCVAGAMMTVFDQSQLYLSRLLLGVVLPDLRFVTVFYAAASIGNLFVVPVGFLGSFILSVLAGERGFVLHGKRYPGFLAACLLVSSACGGACLLLGPPIVRRLYGGIGVEAAPLFGWTALSCLGMSAVMLLRPIVLKYGKLRTATCVSAATVGLQAAVLPWAASRFGLAGAAAALSCSNCLGAALWLFVASRVARQQLREVPSTGIR